MHRLDRFYIITKVGQKCDVRRMPSQELIILYEKLFRFHMGNEPARLGEIPP